MYKNVENVRSDAAKAIEDADNAPTAQKRNDSEKARALKITFEAEKVRCDAQKQILKLKKFNQMLRKLNHMLTN